MKLDYSLESPEERNQLVRQILEETENPSPAYLEALADYLILCMEKQERKQKNILTENRLVTVNRREVSFEGLVSQLEHGEDGIYNLIKEDKNMIFYPKISITKKDLEEIWPLKQVREAISIWENKLKIAQGKDAYIIKKALIELRKDQYSIKAVYRCPISCSKITKTNNFPQLPEEKIEIGDSGELAVSGISFLNPQVVSAFLCNYSKIKEDSWDRVGEDLWCIIQDFDELCGIALKPYPIYEKIVEAKIDGLTNSEIQQVLEKEFNIKRSIEYISSLWRKKIPLLIASVAEDEYLTWYYTTQEKGKYKYCRRCGQVKLAHMKYFSINKTSKDGLYSICKCCRNKKQKEK